MKKKERWYYTSVGKTLRGFLCLILIALVTSGTVYLGKMYSEYGMEMFNTHKVAYQETDSYKEDVRSAISQLQSDMEIISGYKGDISMIDTQNNVIVRRSCDEETSEKNLGYMIDTEDISITSLENMEIHFEIYKWAYEILKERAQKDSMSYIYFTKDSFRELFKKCGSLNANYRYSHMFPESSYFVFPNNTTIDDTESFAVYNPEDDVYYSTWDDYFPIYSTYIYRADEILEQIESNGEYDFDNIILPLLLSYNYGVNDVATSFQEYGDEIEGAYSHLRTSKEDALVYYYSNWYAIGDWKTNVEQKSSVSSLPYCYYVGRSELSEDIETKDLGDLFGAELESTLENQFFWSFEESTDLFFAMDYKRTGDILKESGNSKVRNFYYYLRYENYNNAKTFFIPILVVTVISFIVLVYLTITLVITTGRRGNKDEETGEHTKVHLIFFDKLPTEPYIVFNIFVLYFSGYIGFVIFYEFYKRFREYLVFSLVGMGACAVVYGFLFMMLSLSFIRRLKAQNLWNHIGIMRFIRWIISKGVAIYRRQRGKRLLLGLFGFYMFVQVILFVFMLTWAAKYESVLPYVIAFFLCIVPNVCAVFAVRNLFEDVTRITKCMDRIKEGDLEAKCGMEEGGHFLSEVADGVDNMGDGIKLAVEKSLRDEHMRTQLITNVSHDLKTPLTSIINYVDLLKKEEMPTEEAKHYVDVLEKKSQRLKHLTEDLVEAAKANTGNIELECIPLAFDELMRQAVGEFEDKFVTRDLKFVASFPSEPAIIMADGRRLFRIVENVLQNAFKYAMAGTRIYADIYKENEKVFFTLKNISEAPLNISPDELMERFTRGDSSRSTEGSGLGLSIAKDLTVLMEGSFTIQLDGDLFKVVVEFPEYINEEDTEEVEEQKEQGEEDNQEESN